jgi:hypothetical protein
MTANFRKYIFIHNAITGGIFLDKNTPVKKAEDFSSAF